MWSGGGGLSVPRCRAGAGRAAGLLHRDAGGLGVDHGHHEGHRAGLGEVKGHLGHAAGLDVTGHGDVRLAEERELREAREAVPIVSVAVDRFMRIMSGCEDFRSRE